jgi:small conductance mechanosensitive channel
MTSLNPAAGAPGRALRTLFALLFSGLLLLGASVAVAQEAADSGVSDAEVDALVRTLEDPDRRAKLIEQLKLLKSAQEAEAPTSLVADGLGAVLLSALSDQVEEVSRGFAAVGTVVLAAPDALLDLVQQAGEPATRQRWLEIAVKLAIVLGAALIAKWLAERLLARPRRAVESRGGDSLWVKIPMLGLRGIIEFLPIVAFYVVANAVLPLTDPRPATSLVALTIINANVIARAVRALAALVLCPAAPALRLPRMSDESANYAYIWVSRLTAVSVYGYFFAEAALLLGLPPSVYELLLRAIGLFVGGMVIVVILQNRTMVADWLRGRVVEAGSAAGDPSVEAKASGIGNLRQRLADVWHVLAIVYVVATYGIWALDVPGGFEFLLRGTVLTAVVLGLLRLLLGLVQRGVARGFALSGELRARYPRLEGRANRYLPVFERLIRAVLYLLAALWLLEIWGVDSFGWLASEFGRRLTGSLVTIAVIIVVTALLLEIMDAIIERYLAPKDSFGRVVVRSARVRTLLPLIRNAFRVVLGVMVTLIVLSELGINIAPLLAGAGVVGLAIGFGAQTLVKDVITGFFILAEDAVSVGDVVEISGATGVVEAMTIRSIRLRDGMGSVHTIPFSAVAMVKNLTKDFSYAQLDVAVAYDSDIDAVADMMREVAQGLRKDERFRWSILDDLEVMGLDKFTQAALTLLARIKTQPGQQWSVMREFNRRLKRLFDERGVEIPLSQRPIQIIAPPEPEKPQGDGTA